MGSVIKEDLSEEVTCLVRILSGFCPKRGAGHSLGREWCSGEALKAGLEELRGRELAGTQVEEGDWALGQVTQDQGEELGF